MVPWKAPCRNNPCMKEPTFNLIWPHRGVSFGSNTTHWVPSYKLDSRKSARRRMGTYFHCDPI